MTKRGLYRLLTAAAVLVVLLNIWLASHALGTLFSADRWLTHTLEVISATDDVFLQVSTANSSARAFLLTGDRKFQGRYEDARHAAYVGTDRFQRLTADNVSQGARLTFLRHRMAIKYAALDAAMAVRSGHPGGVIDPAVLQPALADSPDGGPSVKYCIQQMESEERRLLIDREAQAASGRHNVIATFAIASLLDLFLLVVAFELLVRALDDRQVLANRANEIDSLNDQLTLANVELEDRIALRTRELESSNRELEAFSYSVSHDLRAPLRTIDGFSLALQEDFSDKLNAEGLDYIQRVRNGVQRMGTLIDALLQLSRVTRSELTTEHVDLSQLATLVFEELKAAEPTRDVTFSAQPEVLAQGDSRLLRIALENLIGNAWKFTSRTPAARIEFASELREGRTVYVIRDNGAGFDMQYVDRLFTAFQRLHGERDFKGSGIGLATVSRIIRRHHGEIGAESKQGFGATFFFSLGE